MVKGLGHVASALDGTPAAQTLLRVAGPIFEDVSARYAVDRWPGVVGFGSWVGIVWRGWLAERRKRVAEVNAWVFFFFCHAKRFRSGSS